MDGVHCVDASCVQGLCLFMMFWYRQIKYSHHALLQNTESLLLRRQSTLKGPTLLQLLSEYR